MLSWCFLPKDRKRGELHLSKWEKWHRAVLTFLEAYVLSAAASSRFSAYLESEFLSGATIAGLGRVVLHYAVESWCPINASSGLSSVTVTTQTHIHISKCPLGKELANFSCKDPESKYFGFCRHMVSVTTTPQCFVVWKQPWTCQQADVAVFQWSYIYKN